LFTAVTLEGPWTGQVKEVAKRLLNEDWRKGARRGGEKR